MFEGSWKLAQDVGMGFSIYKRILWLDRNHWQPFICMLLEGAKFQGVILGTEVGIMSYKLPVYARANQLWYAQASLVLGAQDLVSLSISIWRVVPLPHVPRGASSGTEQSPFLQENPKPHISLH